MEDGVSLGEKKQVGISFTFDSDLSTEPSLYQLWKITGARGLNANPACIRRLRNRSWRLLSHSALRGCKVTENSMSDVCGDLDVSGRCRDNKSGSLLRESVCPIDDSRETGGSPIRSFFVNDGGVERIGSKRVCAKRKSQLMGRDGLIQPGLPKEVENLRLEAERGRSQDNGVEELSEKPLKSDKEQGGQTFFIESSSPLRTALDVVDESNSNLAENETSARMRKQGSLFENLNTQTGFRRDWYLFESSSAGSTDVSEDGEDEEDDGCNEYQMRFSSKGELDEEKATLDYDVVKENDKERYNDSEWEFTSSDDERSSGRRSRSQLSFRKRQSFFKNNSSEKISSDPDSLGMPIKRSLLSGLFLNEMNRDEGLNPDTRKPSLKRSSTTGLISSNLLASRNTPRKTSSSNRSNLSMLLDTPHHDDFIPKQGSPYNSLDNSSSGKKPLLAKQKSSVGVSDFNVTSNTARERDDIETTGGNRNNDLSSSLSKYAKNSSTSSLKSVLSKSNLPAQLSSLFFNKHKPKRQTGSEKSDLDKEDSHHGLLFNNDPYINNHDSNNEEVCSATSSLVMPRKDGTLLNSAFKENSPSDRLSKFRQVRLTSNLDDQLVTSELSNSLKESINIDSRLGKVPLPAKVIDEKIDDDNLSDNVYYYDYHSRGW